MIQMKTQKLATNAANTFNRVHQLTQDVLVLNQYNLKTDGAPGKRAAQYLTTALENIQMANIELLNMQGAEPETGTKHSDNKSTQGALGRRRQKVVAMAAVLQGVSGTPLIDEKNPLPVAKEAKEEAPATTPAKAADKKATVKKPTAKGAKTPQA